MRLIDEIDAPGWRLTDVDGIMLPYSRWLDIKAALQSADLMANRIRNDYEPGHPAWAEMESFRAATEGTK